MTCSAYWFEFDGFAMQCDFLRVPGPGLANPYILLSLVPWGIRMTAHADDPTL